MEDRVVVNDCSSVLFLGNVSEGVSQGVRVADSFTTIKGSTTAMRRGFDDELGKYQLSDNAQKILNAIKSYEGIHRAGDRYSRMLFDCLLMFYKDKFGEQELSRAIEKIFVWAYYKRIEKSSVYLATIDNFARDEKLFIRLQKAITPNNFLNYAPSVLEKIGCSIDKKITDLFQTIGYLKNDSKQ